MYPRIIWTLVIGFFGVVNTANAQIKTYKTAAECNSINPASKLVAAVLILECTKCIKRGGQWGTVPIPPNKRETGARCQTLRLKFRGLGSSTRTHHAPEPARR